MRDIRASAEVEALIGTESLRELEKDAFSSYDCSECGMPGTTTDPTSVVVHRYRSTAIVRLAHARCTDSKIAEFDAEVPPGLGLDHDLADMRAMTLVLDYPGESTMRPLLLLERRIEAARLTAGGERINVTLATVLGHGLALMSTGGQLPDLAEGWRLLRPDRSSGLLLGPGGEVVYRGGCAQPGEWVRLVDAVGACVVLIGTIGLYAVPGEELTTSRVHQMLDEAARAGSLVGGLVACPRGEIGSSDQSQLAAELASRIQRFWDTRDQ
jgi:hypothetical protein